MLIRTGVLTLAVLAASLPAVAWSQLEDQIYTESGAPTRGTITMMSRDEVAIDTSGGQRRMAVNEIRKINYGGEPNELRSARDQAIKGQLEDALADLNKLNPADAKTEVIKQDIEFYKAYCQGKLALSGGGDKAAAVRAMLAFVTGSPQNYHFYEAAELLGDLALALPSYDNAVKYYSSLASAPWPEYKMKSAVLVARTLVAQENFAEALTRYEQVLGMGLDTAEAARQKQFAQVGKAVCLAQTGKPDEGIALVEKVIQENDPQLAPLLFGRAYNALGSCYRAQNKPKDAILAYLHTDLMFYADPDTHAEALYYLSDLWTTVQEPQRAVKARGLLKERYAGSTWAK